MKSAIIECPICGKRFSKSLYTLGFIHCNDGCKVFFDIETLEILETNKDGQLIAPPRKIIK